jgi:hypothetical protein
MYLKEIYSKLCVSKNMFNAFPIQNGLKQGDALLSVLFNLTLEYVIRKEWNWME